MRHRVHDRRQVLPYLRPAPSRNSCRHRDAALMPGLWAQDMRGVAARSNFDADLFDRVLPGTRFPSLTGLRYLHFHEIKRSDRFADGGADRLHDRLGCVAGAIGVSLFYRASNLAEFQAIQMWRIEWLLAATASFVAGILLKKPSDSDQDRRQRLVSCREALRTTQFLRFAPVPAARRCWCMRYR